MALLAIVFGGLGVLLLLAGATYLNAYWTMRSTDPTDVAKVSGTVDEVELEGTARTAGETARAPLTGEDALVHEWDVEYRTGGQHKTWSNVERGSAANRFLLEDGTGELLVDPAGASWSLEEETWCVDDGEEPPPTIRTYLEASDSDREAASEVVHSKRR
ncbi:MAG: hypothetical protein V5A43_04470 [Haloarculaceae archaeon]